MLPYQPKHSDALIEGYRRLDEARVKTGRRVCSLTDERLFTTRSVLRKEARIARAVWDLVHRHLIAVELRRLRTENRTADELQLVLLAERRVEALGSDLESGR